MIERTELTVERWFNLDESCTVFILPSGYTGKYLLVSEDVVDIEVSMIDQAELDRLRACWQDKQLVCRQYNKLKYAMTVAYPHGDDLSEADRAWADRVMTEDMSAENGYYELALLGPAPERLTLDHENRVR
jgi:hypothetical protein